MESSKVSSLPPTPPSRAVSPSSFNCFSDFSVIMDDLLGSESGVCLTSDEDFERILSEKQDSEACAKIKAKRYAPKKPMDYPPPLPFLVQSGKRSSRVPWALNRYYERGTLVLKEERALRHEYLEARREKGRLILNLVPLDDAVRCCHEKVNDDVEVEGKEFAEQEDKEKSEEVKISTPKCSPDGVSNPNMDSDSGHDMGSCSPASSALLFVRPVTTVR